MQEQRECRECGKKFKTDEKAPVEGLTAMQKWVDHTAGHGNSPAEWTEAYRRIQMWKERAKSKSA